MATDAKIPSPAFFKNMSPFYSALKSNSRTTFLRLANLHACYACDKPINPYADGDHVVPKVLGGSDGPENYGPMCPKCNSSKGKRDALEWLAGAKSFNLETMNLEILVVYTRQMFKLISKQGLLDNPAPGARVYLTRWFASRLPTLEHRMSFEAITANKLDAGRDLATPLVSVIN